MSASESLVKSLCQFGSTAPEEVLVPSSAPNLLNSKGNDPFTVSLPLGFGPSYGHTIPAEFRVQPFPKEKIQESYSYSFYDSNWRRGTSRLLCAQCGRTLRNRLRFIRAIVHQGRLFAPVSSERDVQFALFGAVIILSRTTQRERCREEHGEDGRHRMTRHDIFFLRRPQSVVVVVVISRDRYGRVASFICSALPSNALALRWKAARWSGLILSSFLERARKKRKRERKIERTLSDAFAFRIHSFFSFSSNPRRVSVRRVRRNSRLLSAELEARVSGCKKYDETTKQKKGSKRQDHMNQGLEYQHYNFSLYYFFPPHLWTPPSNRGRKSLRCRLRNSALDAILPIYPADKTDKPRANKAGPTC